ncbi:acid phosphatase 1-like [Phragmites australis]|uniref:acid phosphatase 1-like n=1 Tax=Phragmites australis TaxID=29695 RepID=UPI002D79417D|nr:acid phosphatase 1-like [Phragmites australis]
MVLSMAAHRWKLLTTLVVVPCFSILLETAEGMPWLWPPSGGWNDPYCLSWRVMVEANNAKGWRVVPPPCVGYVQGYMAWGQYRWDVGSVADQAAAYAAEIAPAGADGLDAWVLDVDDTCLSNLLYYQAKQFGAYDPVAFRMWASRGICPGIPAMQQLFQKLKGEGFRVFLVTGRDEETLGSSTAANLVAAGFSGYDRLIMRGAGYRGQSSVAFKSAMRRQLVEEGYRIRGNVGDQWSDLQGDCTGERVFKVPNPMYFVP